MISDGSAKKIFSDLEVDIAGKTGTAEELKNGHIINHAFFVSFAPYQDPEIAVTVNIPYGYSSSNAATGGQEYLPVLLRLYRSGLYLKQQRSERFQCGDRSLMPRDPEF